MNELRYPHLDDTDFPDVVEVDVYDVANDFDYDKWTDDVRIKLMNVPWESDNSHAVYFGSEEERDAWFNAQEGGVYTLPSMFHVYPDGRITLPIPYPEMLTYNYIVVDVPVMPVPYAEPSKRFERSFWYILDVEQSAPNTTVCIITQDWWTGYIYNTEINFMMLRRGHAPMTKVDVDTYLESPVDHTEWLTSPDVNFGDRTNVSGERWYAFGNGDKMLCFATTMPLELFENGGLSTNPSGGNSSATFSDCDEDELDIGPRTSWHDQLLERWYQDFVVSGWNWGVGEKSWEDAKVEIDTLNVNGTHGSVMVYAVHGSIAQDFVRAMHESHPQWFQTVLGAFDVSTDMISRDVGFDVVCRSGRYKAFRCREASGLLGDVHLSRNDFDYPERYAGIAKLYTFPYSFIEITDMDGKTVDVRVEQLSGKVQARFKTAMNYPWIDYTAFFSGICGTETSTYEWKLVEGNSRTMHTWGGDWLNLMWSYDIPVFALFQKASDKWALDNAGSQDAARSRALTVYRNADDGANSDRANMVELHAQEEVNDKRVALVRRDNDTRISNRENSNVYESCALNERNEVRTQQAASFQAAKVNQKLGWDTAVAAVQQTWSTGLQTEAMMTTSINSSIGQVGASTLTGAVAGAAVGGVGAVPGAVVGFAIGATTAIAAIHNSSILITKERNLNKLIVDCNEAATTGTQDINSESNEFANGYYLTGRYGGSTVYGYDGDYSTGMNWEICSDSQDTLRDISDDTTADKNLGYANRYSAYFTNYTEISDQKRKNDNATQNSRTRQAKRTMLQARTDSQSGYLDARHMAPVQVGAFSGNASQDIKCWRGMQLKIRTQSEGAISQAGDAMLRFGYMTDRNWKFEDFNLMEHFTYWQCDEVWLIGGERGMVEEAQEQIKKMLMGGVTVWRVPEELGRVSIYDNPVRREHG